MRKLPTKYKELIDYITSRLASSERLFLEARVPMMYKPAAPLRRLRQGEPQFVSPDGMNLTIEDSSPQHPCINSFRVKWLPDSKMWLLTSASLERTKVSTVKAVLTLVRWGE